MGTVELKKNVEGKVTQIDEDHITIDGQYWADYSSKYKGFSVGDQVTYDQGNPETGTTALNIRKR